MGLKQIECAGQKGRARGSRPTWAQRGRMWSSVRDFNTVSSARVLRPGRPRAGGSGSSLAPPRVLWAVPVVVLLLTELEPGRAGIRKCGPQWLARSSDGGRTGTR
jgi:hypothetical protein